MTLKKTTQLALTLLSCSTLVACSALDRVASIGEAPEVTKISNPVAQENYQPVSLPMPAPKKVYAGDNSLWSSDRKTFFKDQRAGDIGDIVTVLINIEDEAEIDNATTRTRSSNEDAQLPSLLGYQNELDRFLPTAVDNTDLAAFDSTSNHTGSGTTEREEAVEVQLAALVTQILPNGNMVINGRQEVVVNFEKRLISIDGVIRREDITTQNTISYERIAEARIVYGGEGQITDVQQPRYGQQLYDIVFPF